MSLHVEAPQDREVVGSVPEDTASPTSTVDRCEQKEGTNSEVDDWEGDWIIPFTDPFYSENDW